MTLDTIADSDSGGRDLVPQSKVFFALSLIHQVLIVNSMMKPFEEEGDTLIRHLTLAQYSSSITRLARDELHCGGGFEESWISRSLAPLRDFLKDFDGDWGYLAAIASAYASLSREVRGRCTPYKRHFGTANAKLDPIGDLMPMTALRPRKEPPTIWDMKGLVKAVRWLTTAHRPRLERVVGLTLLRGAQARSADHLATKSTNFLERVLSRNDASRWGGLTLGREYRHVEKCISLPNLRCSRDGYWLHMKHGQPGPWHWEAAYSYWDMTVLAERAATWDAGWVLGRVVELVETEAYMKAATIYGAEMRRSGVDTKRCPRLFDDNGTFKPLTQ